MSELKLMLVAGARPNFMKIASIANAVSAFNRSPSKTKLRQIIVHTGQHYDEMMSHTFFRDLGIPKPDIDLGVGSGSHAQQTAEIMKRFEPVLMRILPDVVLVVGDVNSTIACSLVAAKANYPPGSSPRVRPLIAHVEAGLRSFDRSMPEEINRILTDALADLHFLTEKDAARNLIREGISKNKLHWVGNTMVDTLLRHRSQASKSTILSQLGLVKPSGEMGASNKRRSGSKADCPQERCLDYALLTLHRPGNVDNRKSFQEILEALLVIAPRIPILFPTHPRTMARIREFGMERHFRFGSIVVHGDKATPQIHCMPPLGYLDFVCLMSNARLILTDSGGIQEESTVLGIPCVTLRENTERPVTLSEGSNVIGGTTKGSIVRHALLQLKAKRSNKLPRYWDGKAGNRIVKLLVRECGKIRP
ncbi:MAG: UDP-N-acetylglucosamine 2-epimerase (non-hydrolyzing) [Terriglobia bacterium]